MADEAPGRARSSRHRVFFAIWPGAAETEALFQAARHVQAASRGRALPRENLHLTLAFVGDVSPARLAELEALAGEIRGQAFELVLDRLDWVPKKRIVWAGTSNMPAGLADLAHNLAAKLRTAGYAIDSRPFTAHVTLIRKAERSPGELPALGVAWRAREFVLVESVLNRDGARYRIVGRWPLAGVDQR